MKWLGVGGCEEVEAAGIMKENRPRKEEGMHPAGGKYVLLLCQRETSTKEKKMFRKDLQKQYKREVSVVLFSWVRLQECPQEFS